MKSATLSATDHINPLDFPSPIVRHRTIAAFALASALLQSLIFAPISIWPLAYICMAPWLILTAATTLAPRVYFYSFVLGVISFLINMRWMYAATGWGYLALAVYQAAYFPFVACPVRHAARRRRWPLAIVFPFIWVGSEALRSVVISGFPWFYLAHSQYRFLTVIQISDLVGAYGVSFVVAAVNGAIADHLLAKYCGEGGTGTEGRRDLGTTRLISIVFAGFLLLAVCFYGQVQLRRNTITEGPKVALLQGDYFVSVEGPDSSEQQRMQTYFEMIEAAAVEKPDLFVLPETPWYMFLNPEGRDFFQLSRTSFARFQRYASQFEAYVVTGSASLERTPHDLLAKERRYNSATVFHPDGREPGRYDKVHLVPFGEYVPFRFGRLRPLYLWLNRMMPFAGEEGDDEYSLFPGQKFNVFAMTPPSQPDKSYRFGTPICYEDVMPYVSREFVFGGSNVKRCDFLLNISNDGWYGRGAQQPQHLAICAFRAVENRVGIARSVTTGVSAFIDPNGRIYDRVTGNPGKGWPQQSGFRVSRIQVDSRYAIYSRYGDWFAWGCALLWLLTYIDYWIARARALGEA